MAGINAVIARTRRSHWNSRAWQFFFLIILVAMAAVVGLASSALPMKIIFGLLAGAITFTLIYRNLYFGICLYLVFNLTLPQAGPGIDLGYRVAVTGETRGIHFNIHEIVMTMVLVAWLIQVVLDKKDFRERSPIIFPVIAYVLVNILSCFIGSINGGSFLVMSFRFVRVVFFVYIVFVMINNVMTREQLKQIVLIIMICSTLVAGYGVAQKFIGQTNAEKIAQKVFSKLGVPDSVNYVAGEGEGQAYRINSTFLHPNVLGAYNVLVLPLFVSLLWAFRKIWQRLLLLCGLGINLGCLYLTGSRAAWIALGLIIFIYAIFSLFDGRLVLLAVAVLMVIMILFILISPPQFIKVRTQSFSAQEAAKARMAQYRFAINFFLENPIFGVGMGMEGERIEANNIREQWAAVENAFLTLAVSHGLVGLTCFLLVFVYFWGTLFFVRAGSKKDPFLRYTSEALILGMVGVFASSMFGAWLLFAIPMVTMFWFFVGFGACVYNVFQRDVEGVETATAKAVEEKRRESGAWEPVRT